MPAINIPETALNYLNMNKFMLFGLALWTFMIIAAESTDNLVKNQCLENEDRVIVLCAFGLILAFLSACLDALFDIYRAIFGYTAKTSSAGAKVAIAAQNAALAPGASLASVVASTNDAANKVGRTAAVNNVVNTITTNTTVAGAVVTLPAATITTASETTPVGDIVRVDELAGFCPTWEIWWSNRFFGCGCGCNFGGEKRTVIHGYGPTIWFWITTIVVRFISNLLIFWLIVVVSTWEWLEPGDDSTGDACFVSEDGKSVALYVTGGFAIIFSVLRVVLPWEKKAQK
eukprot:TRINITY_DN13951_c0_g1_i2.p1 TRINITY_DN13951_c0_g1~~TRINITY_DN13951_c0_g1_i2.p1  ORF type:complete len:288 (-),score=48.47 TRINITY_DN13951_c0_g1_i2:802-1665(-)